MALFKRTKLVRNEVSTLDSLLRSILINPLNEIRGHVTAPLIRDWIKENATNTVAAKCVVVRNREKSSLSLLLVDKDDQFIYDKHGERRAVSFALSSMDQDVEQILAGEDVVVLSLD
jgi:hypothetical protein